MQESEPTKIPTKRIGEIRNAIKSNKVLKTEEYFNEYHWYIYDRPIGHFAKDFFTCLPSEIQAVLQKKQPLEKYLYSCGEALKKYIQDTLAINKSKRLTAIVFGGPGSNFFSSFNDFFDKTVGVCLEDIRDESKTQDDEHSGHSIVKGDILDLKNFDKLIEELEKKLGTKKVDFIMTRMCGPLHDINKDVSILEKIFRHWYEMLNANGLIFIQFNYVNIDSNTDNYDLEVQKNIKLWVEKIKEMYPDIDIQLGNGVLRIHKKPGSPDKLPKAIDLFKEEKK